jgi:hypothetical protein
MSTPEDEAIYVDSVSWRLIRTTVEYAYVSVPIAGDMVKPDAQGVYRIQAEAMGQRAVDMGQSPEVVWYREQQRIDLHPQQKEPAPYEQTYRPWEVPPE